MSLTSTGNNFSPPIRRVNFDLSVEFPHTNCQRFGSSHPPIFSPFVNSTTRLFSISYGCIIQKKSRPDGRLTYSYYIFNYYIKLKTARRRRKNILVYFFNPKRFQIFGNFPTRSFQFFGNSHQNFRK